MKKTNIRLLATFAMLATAVLPGWADLIVETDFQRKMPVAFSGYAGTSSLTNFPALLTYTATTVEYTVPPSATLIILH